MITTLKLTCTAPRWAGFKSFVKDYCFLKGIEYEIEEDAGWILVDYRVKLKGTEMQVMTAKLDILQSIVEFNA